MAEPNVTSTDTLTRANEAVGRGSWEEARDLFQRSLAVEETPEALEGLGVAASWLDDADAAAEARERAYRLYRRRGDRLEAGRVAVSLAMAHLEFLSEPAPASGWLRRARRVLEGLDPTPINGWIALGEGFIAAVYEKDVSAGLCMVQAGDVRRACDPKVTCQRPSGSPAHMEVLAGTRRVNYPGPQSGQPDRRMVANRPEEASEGESRAINRVIVVQPGMGEAISGGTSVRHVKVDIENLHVTEYSVGTSPIGDLHTHERHADAFYVLEGELEVALSDTETVLPQGEVTWSPPWPSLPTQPPRAGSPPVPAHVLVR